MQIGPLNKRIDFLIPIALFLVTIFITPTTTFDPINLPKLWILISFSTAILFITLFNLRSLNFKDNKIGILASIGVPLTMLISLVLSDAPTYQQVIGSYGRNTGLLAYLGFAVLFLATAYLSTPRIKRFILTAIASAFLINAAYGFLQAVGLEPFSWNNPYSPVIGTFGNPNFAAAFLGMGNGFALTYLLSKSITTTIRLLAAFYILVATFSIVKSDAQQGLIVSLLSIALVGYFYIRSKFKLRYINLIYISTCIAIALAGVLGTLQKGPLNGLIYKPSVTYRGDYWKAGLKMFKDHPLFGVGLDSYGDFYRAERTLNATLRRGPSTVTNASHNVFIDLLSTSGIFTFIAYILLIVVALRSSWRIFVNDNSFKAFEISIFILWIGYLVQSLISINNLALGIWGWILPGLLIAIDRWKTDPKIENKKSKSTDFSGMILTFGLVVGGVFGFIPFGNDANYLRALQSGNEQEIIAAANKWPLDWNRLNKTAEIFQANNLPQEATELARKAVAINPRNFDAWWYLYNSPLISGNEKQEILVLLKKLDPNNPDLKKLG